MPKSKNRVYTNRRQIYDKQPNKIFYRREQRIRTTAPVGGGGGGVGAHAVTHESGASDELDGDHLDIDFEPVCYFPNTAPAEATLVDHLAAHLSGIDLGFGEQWFDDEGRHWVDDTGTPIKFRRLD